MARWLEQIQEYDFSIIHRQGRKHINADALSHIPCTQCGRDSHLKEPIPSVAVVSLTSGEDMTKVQLEDEVIGPVLKAKLKGEKPSDSQTKALGRPTRRLFQLWNQLVVQENRLHHQFLDASTDSTHLQLVIPRCEQGEVLKEMHEGTLGGLLGEEKTLARTRESFYWPGYYDGVSNYIKICRPCAQWKTPPLKRRTPLQSIKVGSPMQLVAMHILGPLPESEEGNSYILVIADYFTRWTEAFPIPNQEASTVARVLINDFFFSILPT